MDNVPNTGFNDLDNGYLDDGFNTMADKLTEAKVVQEIEPQQFLSELKDKAVEVLSTGTSNTKLEFLNKQMCKSLLQLVTFFDECDNTAGSRAFDKLFRKSEHLADLGSTRQIKAKDFKVEFEKLVVALNAINLADFEYTTEFPMQTNKPTIEMLSVGDLFNKYKQSVFVNDVAVIVNGVISELIEKNLKKHWEISHYMSSFTVFERVKFVFVRRKYLEKNKLDLKQYISSIFKDYNKLSPENKLVPVFDIAVDFTIGTVIMLIPGDVQNEVISVFSNFEYDIQLKA